MSVTAGLDMNVYRMTSGSFASPTWGTLISEIVSVEHSDARTEIEVKQRGSNFKKYLPGLKDSKTTFTLNHNVGQTDIAALRTAYADASTVVLAFATGPIATSGTEYLKIECFVLAFNESQPLEEAATISVTVGAAATSSNDPTRVTVS